jgi:hypothetical protein
MTDSATDPSSPHDRPGWYHVRTIDDLALVYLIPGQPVARGEALAQLGQQLSSRIRHRLLHHPSKSITLSEVYERSPLSSFELRKYQLALYPSWAPAPLSLDKPWRQDPRLVRSFHPRSRDDLEVLFFSPQDARVDVMWVRVDGVAYEAWGYEGTLLSACGHALLPARGQRVIIRGVQGAPLPVYLSPTTQEHLRHWSGACELCGFDLLLADLKTLTADHPPVTVQAFSPQLLTTRCPLCQGHMIMRARQPSA